MKMLFLALALLPAISLGAYKKPADQRFILNQSFGASTQLGDQVAYRKEHVMRAQWSQAAQGSTTSSIELRDVDGKPGKLPINSIVTDCLIDVKSALTLDTSVSNNFPYFSLGTGLSGATADLKANVPASALQSGVVACIPVGTAATSIKITTESTPVLKVTSASYITYSATTPSVLTAGKVNVLIKYIISE